MNKDDKLKALDAAITQIEKSYGKGSIMKLGDSRKNMNVETVPTGSLSLDIALGLGGVPKGRVIEIYGPESSGKTTVALHMVSEVQKRGGIAGFIDAEHALDPVYAKNIGVDIDNLYISQPDNGEQALEITETMVRSGAVDIVIVDSVAALVPKAEIDGEMGDSHVGLQARLMSQALRKLTGVISKSDFYQSASGKSWCDVWQSGNHYRRSGSEVLCFCTFGRASERSSQTRGRSDRQPCLRESCEE